MNYLVNENTKTVIDITGNESNVQAVKQLLADNNVQVGNFTLNALLQGNVEEVAGFTIMDSEELADSGILNGSDKPKADDVLIEELGEEGAAEILEDIKIDELKGVTVDTSTLETSNNDEPGETGKVVVNDEEVKELTEGEKALKNVLGVSIQGGLGKLGDDTVNEKKRVYTKKEQAVIDARSSEHKDLIKDVEDAGTYLNFVATNKEGAIRWLEFNINDVNTEDKANSRKNPNLFVSPTKKGYNFTLYLEGRSSGERLKIQNGSETEPGIKESVIAWIEELKQAEKI